MRPSTSVTEGQPRSTQPVHGLYLALEAKVWGSTGRSSLGSHSTRLASAKGELLRVESAGPRILLSATQKAR
ncbi:hypothetical protein Mgrana_03257 [Meiothermus granaticius NBRC 107808]|uniref:Uncharacterized protein n=1 Tax=Meiothermus granaticius NBRC 107808 TaxID=1227551 RepID=A0A399F677_9DEIN|nr:hypothetical protein Mgrana_03257 [Meiothermus granaticius NBRC 107808]